ncbi:hypothetical protein RJT34_25270 [Clitoria ternatea]|uniref:Gnk2-homologous domain-containing protein n=1 Tax=Clitoria ternatea TaxID=43366 RepID=A0AAN9IGP6_CLITE
MLQKSGKLQKCTSNPLQIFFQTSITKIKMLPSNYLVISYVFLSLFSFLLFPTKAAPIYSSHFCTNSTKYQPNSTFQTNLNLLLSSLSSNATKGIHFYKTEIGNDAPNTIKGLFLCRGDTLAATCGDCVTVAAREIKHRCPIQEEAIIWYDMCMVRYTNQYFNNIVPGVDISDTKSVAHADLDRFNELLAGLLNSLAREAANSVNDDDKFATGEVNFTSSVTLYGLLQCTPELSLFDCNMCFRSAIAYVPNCCDGKQGARVLLPGCNIRYEVYPFYNSTKTLTPVVKLRSSGRSRFDVILAFVIPIVAAMVLFTFGICTVMRKQARNMIESWNKTDIIASDGLVPSVGCDCGGLFPPEIAVAARSKMELFNLYLKTFGTCHFI